jgi:hypothetical protein
MEEYEYPMGGDWDQTDCEKNYTGKNKNKVLKSSFTEEIQPSRAATGIKSKKNVLDVCYTKFLNTDVYYKKQIVNPETKDFVDEKFPPNENSLLYLNDNNEATKDVTDEEKSQLKEFKWKRVREIMKKEFVLYDKIELEDIHQGQIGNCYFLSALSALAEHHERFEKIFVSKKKSDGGFYYVKFVIQGIPEIVVVDDFFPVTPNNNWFAGATSGYREIWVQILEKAWAKINESYASTIAGLPGEALAALTEAPVVSYIHRKFPGEKINELWNQIKKADENHYTMATNTGSNKDAEAMGLVQSHAYTLIDAYEHEGLRLVKVRNPWGQFEWTGDFSDKSNTWAKYPGLKEKVKYSNKDDGIFYMKFEDYLTYYPYTFICKYENGFHYNFRKVQQESSNHMTAVKINITNPVKIYVGLHQKQQRFYHKVKNYKTQMTRILLARFDKSTNTYDFINSDSNDNDKLFIEVEKLMPGEYHIFSNVHWPYETNCRYIVSTYASEPVEIEPIERDSIPADYLTQILGSYMEKNCKVSKLSENVDYTLSNNDNDMGFYMVNFINKSTNSSELLKVNFSCMYNSKLAFISGDFVSDRVSKNSQQGDVAVTNDSFDVFVQPGKSQMVVWKLLANPWSAKLQPSSMSYSYAPNDLDYQTMATTDVYKSTIEANLKSMVKDVLPYTELQYCEIEVDDGVLVVFENPSNISSSSYKLKVTFSYLHNLKVVLPKSLVLSIPAGQYAYIKLKVQDPEVEYNYSFNYSVKKI